MFSVTTQMSPSEQQRPERSRNAKAQARHRAKRKAYIEQLEQTVTKLQMALGYTPEELESLPPPLIRIRELEQENVRLQKENEDLRRMITDSGRALPHDLERRPQLSFTDPNSTDHHVKRRKTLGSMDGAYTISQPTASGSNVLVHSDSARPPPLAIPSQSLSHSQPYTYVHPGPSSTGTHPSTAIPGSGSSIFSLQAPFQMPHTPSSSANSSPPFSPASAQDPLPLTSSHRSSSTGQLMMANYKHAQRQHPYEVVKLEDERYSSTHHSPGPSHPAVQGYNTTQSTHSQPHTYGGPELATNHAGHHTHPQTQTSMSGNQWNSSYDPRNTHHGALHR